MKLKSSVLDLTISIVLGFKNFSMPLSSFTEKGSCWLFHYQSIYDHIFIESISVLTSFSTKSSKLIPI